MTKRWHLAALAMTMALGACSVQDREIKLFDERELLEEARPQGESGEIATAALFFKDEVDGGNDPFNAGCHRRYSDPACSEDRQHHDGDGCYNRRDLWEWTDRKCHGPRQDIQRYDCDLECRRKGAAAGTCVWVPNHCGAGLFSARCECIVL